MNSKLTCLVLTICIVFSAQDSFAMQWAKTYGGTGDDSAYSIQKTGDDYVVAGYTNSFDDGMYCNGDNIWILNLDQAGAVNWQEFYCHWAFATYNEYGRSIQQTTDGGYIVAGYTNGGGAGSNDFLILKLDHSGTISWKKWFGGGSSDEAFSIQQTRYGGYIVMGRTFSFGAGNDDIWILKLDAAGNVSWQKTFGGGNWDEAYSIQQTTDEGYIVAGYTSSFGAGDSDVWILKLDSAGNVSWQKTYGGLSGDLAYSIQQTTDGGYIVAGYTWSFGAGEADFWVLKLDADGNVGPGYPGTWQRAYGHSDIERATSIQQTPDGGYIMAGYTTSFGAGYDVWIVKLDSSGNISWEKKYGGNNTDNVRSIQQTRDGGYIVAGYTRSFGPGDYDMWIIKIDSKGDVNNCNMIETSATVTGTIISGVASSASVSTPSYTSGSSFSLYPIDTTAEIGVQCFAPDWFPMDPTTKVELNGVWGYLSDGPTPHQFYAVGEDGTIIHYSGTAWSTTGGLPSKDLYGVWGSSGDDIYTVGENCTIFHYESGWTDVSPGLFPNNLNDVWGSSETDVYAVGDGGKIAHYNGSWSEVTSPTTDKLNSIWGSPYGDYVAVGDDGTIIRNYGTSWYEDFTSPTSNDLSEVWGSASNNVYAVGKLGTIIHYDGTSWTDLTATESPTSSNLKGIWGSSHENIFAVGENGTILYYDGDSWDKMDSGSQDSLISTFGTLNEKVMVVGYEGNIYGYNGPSVQGKVCDSCNGGAINEVTVVFDQGGNQQQIKQTDPLGVYPLISAGGGAYELLFSKTNYSDGELTVDLPNNNSIVDHATYLVPQYPSNPHCVSGTVMKTVKIGPEGMERENKRGVQNMVVKLYQGSRELQSTVTDEGGNYHFNGVAAGTEYKCKVEPVIKASICYASPPEHTGITVPTNEQYDFDLDCQTGPVVEKAYWSEMTFPTGIDKVLLHSIWGNSGTDIFAVGDGGLIIHYNGANWSPQTSGTDRDLKGVWGVSGSSPTEVYAVGEDGTVIRTMLGGFIWSSMTSNTSNSLNAIWGDSAYDIFAVGDSGTIIHYDGTAWSTMTSGTDEKLLSVWGSSETDVYAMGNSHMDSYWKRTVIHYDGTDWSPVETGNGVTLMSSWGSSSTDMTATGSFGSILRCYGGSNCYEGSNWKQTGGPTERTFNAMWGAPSGDIFAVGFDGVIAHFDGISWDVRGKDKPDLYGIWGNSPTNVYAVGDKGTILTYNGDMDGDLHLDVSDNCPEVFNDTQTNTDYDSHGDACDNCPNVLNSSQANSDYDTLGNACDDCPFDTDNDIDGDGICGDVDNCPDTANSSVSGTCVSCDDGSLGSTCTADTQCPDGYCSKDQEDHDGDGIGDVCDANIGEDKYPPDGNDCIDACECNGDFEPDGDVDGTDAVAFKTDFFRKNCKTTPPPCNGDFECDGDVDGTDAVAFKQDFFRKDCPPCGGWPCVYE